MKKIFPPLPKNYIPVKEHLVKRLLNKLKNERKKIFYFYSPSGYGKSTLITRFAQKVKTKRKLFLKIEKVDKDGENFWLNFISNLLFLFEKESNMLREVRLKKSSLLPLLRSIIYTLSKKEKVFITLFDFYLLDEKLNQVLQEISEIFENLENFILIIEANSPLPLNISQKFEIVHPDSLLLNEEEILLCADYMRIKLDPQEHLYIKKITEGWIMPVLLYLKSKERGGSFLRHSHFVSGLIEDLFDEIMHSFEETEKQIIYGASQIEKMDSESVKWILGIKEPEEWFNKLLQKGLFVVKTFENDKKVYYFHRVFREYLSRKLHSLSGGTSLYFWINERAAEYYEIIGDIEASIEYYIKLEKWTKVGEFLFQSIDFFCKEKKYGILQDWFERIGESVIKSDPKLSASYMYFLLDINKNEQAFQYFKICEDKFVKDYDKATFYYFAVRLFYNLGNKEKLKEYIKLAFKYLNKAEKELKEFSEDHEKDPFVLTKRKSKSKKLEIRKRKAQIYFILGNALFQEGKYNIAFNVYKKCEELAQHYLKESKVSLFSLWNNIALCLLYIGKLKKSLIYFEKIIQNNKEDLPVKALAYLNAGLIYLDLMEMNAAENYLHKALKIAKKFGDIRITVHSLDALCIFYLENNNLKKATYYFQLLKEYSKEIDEAYVAVMIKLLQMHFLIEKKEFDKVWKFIEENEEFIKTRGSFNQKLIFKKLKAILLMEYGKKEGEELMKEILEEKKAKGDIVEVLKIYKTLCKFYTKEGEKEKIEIIVKEALLLIQEDLELLKNYNKLFTQLGREAI